VAEVQEMAVAATAVVEAEAIGRRLAVL